MAAMASEKMSSWDRKFMRLALHVADWSKDRSTKVGCVVVGPRNEVRSMGYNGFPRTVSDEIEKRHSRPEKYRWTEHAERNAIYNAVLSGTSLVGCRMYLPWYPCVDCARAIVQCGFEELIAVEPDWTDERWGGDFAIAREMLTEAGVWVRFVDLEELRRSEDPETAVPESA